MVFAGDGRCLSTQGKPLAVTGALAAACRGPRHAFVSHHARTPTWGHNRQKERKEEELKEAERNVTRAAQPVRLLL